jgi:hypothetical protein
MYKTLLEAGQELKDFKWFKIPIESLDQDKMIVYSQKGHMVGGKKLLDEDFSDFDINKMSEYEVIGDKTKEYFKRRIQKNESVSNVPYGSTYFIQRKYRHEGYGDNSHDTKRVIIVLLWLFLAIIFS